MPNHDTNHVVLAGTPDDIARFISEACVVSQSNGIPIPDFDKIIPQPADVKLSGENSPPGMEPLWLTWRRANWGTKWNAYDAKRFAVFSVLRHFRAIEMVFDTAWSPPTPVFAAIENKFNLKVWASTIDEGGWNQPEYGDEEDRPVWLTRSAEFDRGILEYLYKDEDNAVQAVLDAKRAERQAVSA